jgi:hypothetical protein
MPANADFDALTGSGALATSVGDTSRRGVAGSVTETATPLPRSPTAWGGETSADEESETAAPRAPRTAEAGPCPRAVGSEDPDRPRSAPGCPGPRVLGVED